MEKKKGAGKLVKIGIEKLFEPEGRIRLEIGEEELQELSDSIKEMGVLQPLLVCADGDRFEIVAGERRWLAAKGAGLKEVPCVVRSMDKVEKALARASENITRSNLTLIEEAAVYQNLIKEGKLTIREVSEKFGKSMTAIRERLALLQMPEEVQVALHAKKIGMKAALVLCEIADRKELLRYLDLTIENGATPKTIRVWVDDWRDSQRYVDSPGAEGSPPPELSLPEKTYAACQLCERPVEYSEVKYLKVCEGCLAEVISALKKSDT